MTRNPIPAAAPELAAAPPVSARALAGAADAAFMEVRAQVRRHRAAGPGSRKPSELGGEHGALPGSCRSLRARSSSSRRRRERQLPPPDRCQAPVLSLAHGHLSRRRARRHHGPRQGCRAIMGGTIGTQGLALGEMESRPRGRTLRHRSGAALPSSPTVRRSVSVTAACSRANCLRRISYEAHSLTPRQNPPARRMRLAHQPPGSGTSTCLQICH